MKNFGFFVVFSLLLSVFLFLCFHLKLTNTWLGQKQGVKGHNLTVIAKAVWFNDKSLNTYQSLCNILQCLSYVVKFFLVLCM